MRLYAIPTAAVPALWTAVEPAIAASCRRAGAPYGPADLLEACLACRATLMVAHGPSGLVMAGVVAIEAGGGALHIQALGGRAMRSWLPVIADLEAFAAHHGASEVRFSGRPGWARVLPGYAAEGPFLVRRIAPTAIPRHIATVGGF